MWDSSRFRGGKNQGPPGGGDDDGHDGSSGNTGNPRRRSPGAHLRLKRIQADLFATQEWGVPPVLVPARLVLNDLGYLSVILFAAAPLPIGQSVSLSIAQPRPLQVRGKITYSALFELSPRIHCVNRYSYRLQIEFEFLNEGEAEAVRQYVDELLKTDLTNAAA